MTSNANKFLLLLAGLLLIGACNKATEVYTDSFVMNYSIHDGIELAYELEPGTAQHGLKLRLKEPVKHVGYNSEGADKQLYDNLREKHNDISFSRRVLLYNGVGGAGAMYPDYTSITVTSDSNFDNAHPAGTSLNDLIDCKYQSSYLYVVGGYADESLLEIKTKALADVVPNDLTMLARLNLYFTKNPAKLDNPHDISVSVTTDDGRTFTASYTMNFNQ